MHEPEQHQRTSRTLLSGPAYLRPSECRCLRRPDVLLPAEQAGSVAKVSLFLDGCCPAKTDVWSDAVLLDDPRHGRQLQSNQDQDECRSSLQGINRTLGLPPLLFNQLRRGGACYDASTGLRPMPPRGRWRSQASVLRYAQTGQVQKLSAHLSPTCRRFCEWCTGALEGVMLGRGPPPAFTNKLQFYP